MASKYGVPLPKGTTVPDIQPQLIKGYYYRPKMNDDGTIGIDYFKADGTPVTNTEFGQATGIDPGAIEQNARNYVDSTSADVLDNTGTWEMPPPASTPPADTSGGTGEDVFKPTPYDDGSGIRIYNTPEELAQAVQRKISKIYNDSVAQIEQQFKQGFLSIDERDDAIKKTRTQLIAKKEGDLQSVSGYFNSIAPDAIQSGRGKLETRAVEDYTNQNKSLGSELNPTLYGANGRIRQDLSASDLSPYMTELSDTGNLARAIAGNYTNRQSALNKAAQNTNDQTTANAYDYANNLPTGSDYTNYLNSQILNRGVSTQGAMGPASVKKTDKYGNPIDDWYNQ